MASSPHNTTAEDECRGDATESKQVRGEAATTLILGAAHELLMDRGYAAMTIEAVADRAGVARATIYHRWSSKQALVVAAARLGLQADLVIPDIGSFREEVRLYLMNRLGWFISGNAARAIEGLMAAAAEVPELSVAIAEGTKPFKGAFRSVFDRGIARGEVRPDTDFTVALSMVSGSMMFVDVFDRTVPDIAFVDHLCDLVVRAVGPDHGSGASANGAAGSPKTTT